MSCVVPRTCTEIPDDERGREATSRPLDAFRAEPAYVLLGDPGSGKTTAFQRECEVCGADGLLVSARDFRALEPASHPEWRAKTLFIDGLDEVRAGTSDARAPLDAIRRNLDSLGRPRFRLSCREADWLGTNDRTKLDAVAPDARVTLLRLDPLTDSDVEEILESDLRVDDSRGFIREARERGVDGFLTNPQTLDMLADVVAGADSWPANRLELFEEACRQMASEHNEEHLAAAARSAGTVPVATGGPVLEDVLDAAGRLCAVQLIAGAAGHALTRSEEDDDFPAFDRCHREWESVRASHQGRGSPSELLRAALATKLFSARANGRIGPVHRHVAEFLGARYLAGLIRGRERKCGLPARRILALITGGDGIVVTQLRGLSAWLAAQCGDVRRDLVERDPIGVGLYGDISGFSTDEKCVLLESLQVQASRLFSVSWTATAFSPLVAPAMERVFMELLTGGRLRAHQSFAWFVLHILAHGSRLPNLSSSLLEIARDDKWSPDVNVAALDAFIHNRPHGRQKTRELKELLADIRAGRVVDPNDDLLGVLLTELHPGELSAADIWKHLSVPANRGYYGRYSRFWSRILREPCAHSAVAEHLDALAARPEVLVPVLQSVVTRSLPVRLLARGLETHGERVEAKRLYDWLGVGLVSRHYPQVGDGPRRIRDWLERHPEIQKSVVAEGLQRRKSDPDHTIRVLEYDFWLRLYDSVLPGDFGLWCLQRAEAECDARLARFLLARAFEAVREQRGNDGLSVDVLIERTRAHPVLADAFAKLSTCPLDDAHAQRQEDRRLGRDQEKEERQQRVEWIAYVRSQQDALRGNRGSLDLLRQLATGYFGFLQESEGKEPIERLRHLFFDDDGLVETTLVALRGAIRRDDLPDLHRIIGLRAKNREHYLSLPVLAGLAELDRTGQDGSLHLDERRIRIALGFHYCDGVRDEAAWYRRLLVSNPGLVADVLARCATSALRCGRADVSGLAELAHDENHGNVARVASLRILESFPVRCKAKQLVDLNYLLWSALRHADPESLAKLIERKLSRTSMNVGQRARWLAAGFMLPPGAYSQRVIEFTDNSERRVRELAAFLGDPDGPRIWRDRLGTAGLQVLVRVIGVSFRPHIWPSGQVTRVTPAMEASGHVRRMIQRLGQSPSDDAGAALEALASDESLVQWRDELLHERNQQRVIHRDAAYRHPEIEQVCRTLNDGPSANAGDLAALVRDRLDDVGRRIRTGNDNGWRPYWNEGKHRRPVEPKYEDSCRDALLAHLRHGLQDAADAQPEGRYGNDKRADIRVACGDFHVPVEIKKNSHPELWSALRNQLIARYTIDLATGGYGIYLVLWFGEDAGRRTPLPASGPRPDGPGALKARLEEDLTPDEARRISVCVIDVSAPASAPVAITDRKGSSESAS